MKKKQPGVWSRQLKSIYDYTWLYDGPPTVDTVGYRVNFTKVIDACAANKVIIEINDNPYRLDMDWSHIPYAIIKETAI